jgi:dihydroxyacetone kinase-like predicted kinase
MWFLIPGANPTIVIDIASAVKLYNAKSSLVRFENKNIFFNFEKCSSLLQSWRCTYVAVKSEVVGLAPA